MIKISIITVTHNCENVLERTIQSVIDQKYPNVEYIVIDGKSDDGTCDVINKYRQFIHYSISEKDSGISDAFNKGIKKATGQLIGIINAGDYLYEKALFEINDVYETKIGVYRGNVIIENIKTGYRCIERPTMDFRNIAIGIKVAHPGTFIKRDIYMKYGMYKTGYKYIMDLDILKRFYDSGVQYKYVDKIISGFTLDGVTMTPFTKERYKEYRDFFRSNRVSRINEEMFMASLVARNIVKNVIPKDILLKIHNHETYGVER